MNHGDCRGLVVHERRGVRSTLREPGRADRLAIDFLQAPGGDDFFGAGREVAELGGDDALFRGSGLLQTRLEVGQLLTTMPATLDFLVTLANSTHVITPCQKPYKIRPVFVTGGPPAVNVIGFWVVAETCVQPAIRRARENRWNPREGRR